MKIQHTLEYDPATDTIMGPHDYIQVVIARNLFENWKQPESENLANFIEAVDIWFNVSNSYSPNAKLDYKKFFTGDYEQIKALDDMYNLISNMIVLNHYVLENFFSQLRQKGGVHDHSAPLSCIYRIRLIILGKAPTTLHNVIHNPEEDSKHISSFAQWRNRNQRGTTEVRLLLVEN
uniref:Uncharacterized protein n=1 Tax=Anopheles funestus TaxID=62324 RepID=A0A182RZZ5_ANOFN